MIKIIKFIFQYCGSLIIGLMLDAEAWFKDAIVIQLFLIIHYYNKGCYKNDFLVRIR